MLRWIGTVVHGVSVQETGLLCMWCVNRKRGFCAWGECTGNATVVHKCLDGGPGIHYSLKF